MGGISVIVSMCVLYGSVVIGVFEASFNDPNGDWLNISIRTSIQLTPRKVDTQLFAMVDLNEIPSNWILGLY